MRILTRLIVWVPAVAVGTAFGGGCPEAMNPCDQESEAPGCSDQACCEAVCAVDSFCCEVAWDGICVGETVSLCNIPLEVCGRRAHSCFTLGDPGCADAACCEMVCGVDGGCCAVAWDVGCAETALKLCGDPACGSADHGCDAIGGPGCSDAVCCNSVCAVLPECCDVAWDQACVSIAATHCDPACGNADHDCCTTGEAGCDDALCCQAVCADHLECCEIEWDQDCVMQALGDCNVPSAGYGCLSCNHDCLSTGLPGCGDVECCDIVCRVDSFCCTVFWDGFCIAEAAASCYGAGDLNGDGVVDGADLGLLLSAWGPCKGSPDLCTADLSDDDKVDGADLGLLLDAWTGSGE